MRPLRICRGVHRRPHREMVIHIQLLSQRSRDVEVDVDVERQKEIKVWSSGEVARDNVEAEVVIDVQRERGRSSGL